MTDTVTPRATVTNAGGTGALYTYPRSTAAMQRALAVIPSGIPGHQGPSEGCYVPVSDFPLFSSRAQGTRFWDADDNEYIDYMCGYGPNVLGYRDPEIDAAAKAQSAIEDVVTIPSTVMVDFAELLVDQVASADWTFFAKNGGDTTTLAIMTARAATRRKRIVFIAGYYHGVAPWTQKLDYPGVLEEDVTNNIIIPWNDPGAFARVLAAYPGEIAAFISSPYMHGNFLDNSLPAPGYWDQIRALCDKHGVVLVIDDVRTGFRLDLAGSDHFYGFKADLMCFCKALANGYNVSCLMGRAELQDVVSSITYTGSYWMSAVPFAAGIATQTKLKELGAPTLFRQRALQLTTGLEAAAADHGLHLVVSGEPALFYLRLADDDSLMLHQEWVAQMMRRGVFLTSHHNHFINAALSPSDVDLSIAIAHEAFGAVRAAHPELG